YPQEAETAARPFELGLGNLSVCLGLPVVLLREHLMLEEQRGALRGLLFHLRVGECLLVVRTRRRNLTAVKPRQNLSLFDAVSGAYLHAQQPPADWREYAHHLRGVGLDSPGNLKIVGDLFLLNGQYAKAHQIGPKNQLGGVSPRGRRWCLLWRRGASAARKSPRKREDKESAASHGHSSVPVTELN